MVGVESEVDEWDDSVEFYVSCQQCGVVGPGDRGWRWAIEKWNKRGEVGKGRWCLLRLDEWCITGLSEIGEG